MADTVIIPAAKSLKRKRASLVENLSAEERESRIGALREEIDGLFRYYKEVLVRKVELDAGECTLMNSAIGCLLEESNLSFSKLVEEIYEKVKGREGVTVAAIRSSVLFVGQRWSYGVQSADADVLEDESESCLWCWETRDLKLLPKSSRGALKIRRMCRKKIQERIIAVSAMMTALQKSESHKSCKNDMTKASEKLGRVLSEAEIRVLAESMIQKDGADIAEKEAKREEKQLIKQLERNKREIEKKNLKEQWQSERELKRLQDEAEKEERRREKEESEMKKQYRRQQEESEKDQRRKEREAAEQKKQLAIQKQASIMERFLQKSKTNVAREDDEPSKTKPSDLSTTNNESLPGVVTQLMDHALSNGGRLSTEDIRKLHMTSWHCLGNSIRLNRKQHWGIRRKPKTKLIKELKLTTGKELARDDEMGLDKIVDGWEETIRDDEESCQINAGSSFPETHKRRRSRQLFQFDKSHRPAFYGIWPKKGDVVGPRNPFKKDPDLDYDIDSDEEWEEEDPGESLSDCDKDDDEENLEEARVKGDDEEESEEDGFFVPDGYLSENEGVHVDRAEADLMVEVRRSPSRNSEELCLLLRQQKHLRNLTDHALKKNQPLIILNLKHEKASLLTAEDLKGTPKLEQTCLQALSMCVFPDGQPIEISNEHNVKDEEREPCLSNSKASTATPVANMTLIMDSDLPKIVSVIQSCPQGINKVVESLQHAFPTILKGQLKNKVRELSDFVDNRWQVKKDILDKLGLSISPEKSSGRSKSIATFFSKRCHPPSGNPNETSPQPSQKPDTSTTNVSYRSNVQ